MNSDNDLEMLKILRPTRSIAMVGASPREDRPSHGVMAYLLAAGFQVVPVNPGQAGKTILGQQVYAALAEIPFPVDLVDVFRESGATPGIVDEAVAMGAKAVWLQLGISNPLARQKAQAAGLSYIEDRCLKVEHARLRPALAQPAAVSDRP